METLRELDIVREYTRPALITRVDPAAEVEPDADDIPMPTMVIRFSPFGSWYEIDSAWEGKFLERTELGAFAKTMDENGSRVKVLFNHGMDPQIGQKILGVPSDLREDTDSAVGEVPMFDTTYNRDLLPGIEAGGYGSSFMFRVIKDEWNDEPGVSDWNPDGIPERTIKEVRLFEFGPVTWPANPEATTGVRSGTDDFYARLREVDPQRVAQLEQRVATLRTPVTSQPPASTGSDTGAASKDPNEPTARHSGGLTPRQRRWQRYPYLKEGSAR